MALITDMTRDCEGILQVGSGKITGDECVQASRRAMLLFQNARNFRYEFVDFSNVTELEFNQEHLAQVKEQDRAIAAARPNAVVVIVAPRDDFYQIGKRWEHEVRELGLSTHVARDRMEALDWLHQILPARRNEERAV
ncbi:MAG: hypothetical protein JO354_02950 [Verrucomicrobia bacterium]|nr:hypothetical protein [Verrucomicrobiota bacterium]